MNTAQVPQAADPTDYFFTTVDRWRREFVEPGVAWALKAIEVASRQPAGASHDSNLYRTEDGRVWRDSFRWVAEGGNPHHHTVRTFVEQVRTGGEYSPYRDGETLEVLSQEVWGGSIQSVNGMALVRSCAKDQEEQSWGWTVPARYGMSSKYYAEGSLRHANAGIAFADMVVAREQEIREWFHARARTFPARTWDDMNGDVTMFSQRFGSTRDTPDPGSIHCAISSVLDDLAGKAGIRAYHC